MTRMVVLQLALTCSVVAFSAAAYQRASAQEPTLNAVNVSFELPKCDDRDNDTRIEMSVISGSDVVAASESVAPGVHFNDPGNYGPYDLPLQRTINKSDWTATKTNIRISPNGHDTWCTKIHVDALFSDNTHIKTNNCSVIKISESNRDYSFPTNACSE